MTVGAMKKTQTLKVMHITEYADHQIITSTGLRNLV